MQFAVKSLLTQCDGGHCRSLTTADDSDNFMAHNASSEIQSGGNVTNTANAQTGIGIDHHATQCAIVAL